MYTISGKLRTVAFVLMILGLIGVVYGFMTSHKSLDDVKEMLAAEHAGHGEDAVDTKAHVVAGVEDHSDNAHEANAIGALEDPASANIEHVGTDAHVNDEHAEHVQHLIANRPWSAIYVAALFFFTIALGALAFYAIQYAAQAGWSPLLLRVMEGITAYMLPGGLIVLAIAILSGTIGHYNIFIWMDPEVVKEDLLIRNKSSYLNIGWFAIRGLIFLTGWFLYRHFARKFSIAQDEANDNKNFKKTFRISAGFLVFFLYTESIVSWDWIMSVDPHWFSTLFGWYVLAGMMVSAITVIAMVTIYLKSIGHLPLVNDSHLHDLAKFMFGFSIFWAYLWFSQFMLIWYSNIPEEVTYFVTRFEDYQFLFLGMVVLNFVFPLLILMNSDFKRLPWFIMMAGIVILVGHYIDVFNMIMPATVGDQWYIGIPEISSMLLLGGVFLLVVFTALTKAPLMAKRNPFIKESEHFHY
ncbi:quinol:cytochrome C oxidoreductase [Subsaximicrobium wynnwilliamsii]|uniref:Quinol:cytochrome C oxidoreductase n=1 Tax=Subsaximicrobium wynnwilliamsii TaxID=291179 RepID=A0A5C6ZHF6_9FLAO|nr:quinol:cytochrome C oxidoreductase [Subsaximicrobium wynnwilliamsii]TXD82428.1 quinol:cytochrome C oxidoreductase [Subsaximicrobium wynnwilliamsii]TXD88070.1 quinol:cytochrome C oxidoreductase [Subsaximicrobium wynnwilliamsii]TXE02068.1 quinol:cytochrome C oxidoreductase [Subsaximicrobium wynnwilliamsii]